MKNYIKALKEIENEDEDFELTLSKKEVLDIVEEIESLNKDNGDITKLFAKEREETKRLHSIIKEVKEVIETCKEYTNMNYLLSILDKVEEK